MGLRGSLVVKAAALAAVSTSSLPLLLLLRRAPRALECAPSERQHLLGIGRGSYQRCVAGGHRGSGISAASVPLFAGPPCTAGT